ncbi:MAG TPA: SAM-dependent methyltransferase [Actinomycetes bacterium]
MGSTVVDDVKSSGVDASVANPARVYDYLLGGKDNFPADRELAEQVIAIAPTAREVTRQNRAFLRRAVRFLAGEAGVRQFLDIGSGLPTRGNVHEIAQAVAPDCRVVYVDNDPVVVAHGRALLEGDNTVVVREDLREPEAIVGDPQVREVLDFDQPIAVLLVSVLHFVGDEQDPFGIVARFRDAVPAGSYLAISHGTRDIPPRPDMTAEEMTEMGTRTQQLYEQAAVPIVNRTKADVARLFGDWDLVDPGLVFIQLWRRDDAGAALPGGFYGAIARKGGPGA